MEDDWDAENDAEFDSSHYEIAKTMSAENYRKRLTAFFKVIARTQWSHKLVLGVCVCVCVTFNVCITGTTSSLQFLETALHGGRNLLRQFIQHGHGCQLLLEAYRCPLVDRSFPTSEWAVALGSGTHVFQNSPRRRTIIIVIIIVSASMSSSSSSSSFMNVALRRCVQVEPSNLRPMIREFKKTVSEFVFLVPSSPRGRLASSCELIPLLIPFHGLCCLVMVVAVLLLLLLQGWRARLGTTTKAVNSGVLRVLWLRKRACSATWCGSPATRP